MKSKYLLCLLLQDNGIRVLTGLVSNRSRKPTKENAFSLR
jgi:hypothetical protein